MITHGRKKTRTIRMGDGIISKIERKERERWKEKEEKILSGNLGKRKKNTIAIKILHQTI
jgi:retron-type reverse transcriptase